MNILPAVPTDFHRRIILHSWQAAFLADAHLRSAGVRERARIVVTAPVPWPLPGPAKSAFEKIMEEKGVEFIPSKYERRAIRRDTRRDRSTSALGV